MYGHIVRPFHDVNGRKYITLQIDDDDLHVKIPFRYNRVMCAVQGLRPVQEFSAGEYVHVEIEKKLWEGDIFYVLKSIKPDSPC